MNFINIHHVPVECKTVGLNKDFPIEVDYVSVLQVYGSAAYNPADFSCSKKRKRECIIGDLTSKCGALNFDGD